MAIEKETLIKCLKKEIASCQKQYDSWKAKFAEADAKGLGDILHFLEWNALTSLKTLEYKREYERTLHYVESENYDEALLVKDLEGMLTNYALYLSNKSTGTVANIAKEYQIEVIAYILDGVRKGYLM